MTQGREAAVRQPGTAPVLVGAGALLALFHLYGTVAGVWPFRDLPVVPTYTYRQLHLGLVLGLAFVVAATASRALSAKVLGYGLALICALSFTATVVDGDVFLSQITHPQPYALVVGIATILLVLEAARRTTGWAMPAISLAFILYALFGRALPEPWAHRGYDLNRLVGHLFLGSEGIFGTPIAVSATLIVLFTIYGAVLTRSGAAEAFVRLSGRVFGKSRHSAVGTIVLSSFLLGGPSGSGVATTVMIGNVGHPLLARRGYSASQSGGLLAAAGLGAVISPPVLGSAAFLLAEMLAISYLDVLWMVVLPTLLYYVSLYLIAAFSAPAPNADDDFASALPRVGVVETISHLAAATSILFFLAAGFSPETSAVFAILTAILLWAFRPQGRARVADIVRALHEGVMSVVPVAAICACAGLVVGVITLTGLGLKLSGIVVHLAGNDLLLASLLAALAVWMVGLAVPITGSYIICAIVVAPALVALGVSPVAAHMFIFYLAVLSEVSPPTALAPFAAAAITGASPLQTTLQAWRFTAPMFVLPFALILEPAGRALLLIDDGAFWGIAFSILIYFFGSAAFALSLCSRAFAPLHPAERFGLLLAGLLLMFPTTLAFRIGLTSMHVEVLGFLLMAMALAFNCVSRMRGGVITEQDF
jgi:TRAP transporter 4TM/12TM fusion protein